MKYRTMRMLCHRTCTTGNIVVLSHLGSLIVTHIAKPQQSNHRIHLYDATHATTVHATTAGSTNGVGHPAAQGKKVRKWRFDRLNRPQRLILRKFRDLGYTFTMMERIINDGSLEEFLAAWKEKKPGVSSGTPNHKPHFYHDGGRGRRRYNFHHTQH